MSKSDRVSCIQCKYYVVTWNPKYPKACNFFGFKSTTMPSVTVYNATGNHCTEFVRKKRGNTNLQPKQ